MTKDTGGPAFPEMHFDLGENEHGMTLRDYFAAKAMQGLLSSTECDDAEIIAKDAYAIADIMLKRREQ